MPKLNRFLAAALLCAAVTGCSDAPMLAPDPNPSFDGGHMLGSGAESKSTAADADATTASDSATTGRGGHMLGSGA